MINLKRILVPTDFSNASVSAYIHAQALAQKYGAKVDLIHVVPVLQYFTESFSKLEFPLSLKEEDLYPHLKDGAQHQMQDLLDDYFHDNNKGEPVVMIHRKPSKAIVEFSRENGYDLIVLASRGKHNSKIRGGVTEDIIRHSHIPVYAVDSRIRDEQLKRILVPTDTSSISFACMPLALTLADAYDSELILFHVLELYGTLSENISQKNYESKELNIYYSLIDSLKNYLWEIDDANITIKRGEKNYADEIIITDGTSQKVFPLKTVIRRGVSAHYEIENYAREDHIDVIVMTTHGYTGLAHFFMGSTAENVIRYTDIPVVTLKPTEKLMQHPE